MHSLPGRALALVTKSHHLECSLLGSQLVEYPEWGSGDSNEPAQPAASVLLPFVFVLLPFVSAPLRFAAVFPAFSQFRRAAPANLRPATGGGRLPQPAFTDWSAPILVK